MMPYGVGVCSSWRQDWDEELGGHLCSPSAWHAKQSKKGHIWSRLEQGGQKVSEYQEECTKGDQISGEEWVQDDQEVQLPDALHPCLRSSALSWCAAVLCTFPVLILLFNCVCRPSMDSKMVWRRVTWLSVWIQMDTRLMRSQSCSTRLSFATTEPRWQEGLVIKDCSRPDSMKSWLWLATPLWKNTCMPCAQACEDWSVSVHGIVSENLICAFRLPLVKLL